MSLDVDEVANTIVVGVKNPTEAGQAVSILLVEQGIPSDAVRTIADLPPQPTRGLSRGTVLSDTTLNNHFNPIPGGVAVSAAGQLSCSMAANAVFNGVSGFVGSSHCGNTFWGLESQPYDQSSVVVGVEHADPHPLVCGWPVRYCRYSDANFVRYTQGIPGQLGYIARTAGLGSTVIDNANPRFRVLGHASVNPVLGELVQMMGRTSGWREGGINATCFDYVEGASIRRCNFRFNGVAGGGDSGGSIFYRVPCPPSDPSLPGNCATFVGVQWGALSGNVYFSPVSGIFRDFGGAWSFAAP